MKENTMDCYLGIKIPAELRDRVKEKCDKLGVTQAELIRALLSRFVVKDRCNLRGMKDRRGRPKSE